MMRCVAIGLGLLALGSPAAAVQTEIGFQILEDFEGRALGGTSIDFCNVAFPGEDCLGTLTGGAVAPGSPAFPAFSPTHVYVGTLITLDIDDNVNYSWPAVSARVSGTAPIRLRAFEYDDQLALDVLVADIWTAGNDVNTLLFFGDDFNLRFLTFIEYSSTAEFAMDDLRLGLVDVLPGVPEPASWMMLIAGFGLVGAAMRRVNARRTATPTG